MGKITSLNNSINNENFTFAVKQIEPEFINSAELRAFTNYFAILLANRLYDLEEEIGVNDISSEYMHIVLDLQHIFDFRSLKKLVAENLDSFRMIYMREPEFRAFAEKFIPDLMIDEQMQKKAHPEVEKGKITQFPNAAASLIREELAKFKENIERN